MALWDNSRRPGVPGFVSDFLAEASAGNLRRELRRFLPVSARELEYGGQRYLNFSSNDYLGLAFHPYVKEEAIRWVERYGAGGGASRLVTGTTGAVMELEERIADWKGAGAALILGSGHMANSGLIPALAGRNAVIFSDKLNHASLNAGCQLSGAKFVRYRHCDWEQLESLLEREQAVPLKLIVSDTIFSMDGDIADPEQLAEIASRHDCLLYLDDAHATGVFGEEGRGLAHGGSAHVVMSTFSKAMGSYGACVLCSSEMREYFINRCGTFIYSTVLPPAVLGAISAAVELVRTGEFAGVRSRLLANAESLRSRFREYGLDTGESSSQIIPVIIGDAGMTLRVSQRLMKRGFIVAAIRPPTVPLNSSRLRISLSGAHSDEDISRLAEAVADAVRQG